MGADEEPVALDESVLRLIHFCYYKAGLSLTVQPAAFRPTDDDTDGISVFRSRFATPAQALTIVAEAKRHLYCVASLPVSDLHSLSLSVKPAPIEQVQGHAVIPELNSQAYQQNRNQWKPVQERLALLASKNLVHFPPETTAG